MKSTPTIKANAMAVAVRNISYGGLLNKLRNGKRNFVMLALASAFTLNSVTSEASGFPTIDIAATIQRILAEIQDLTAYATQLEQQVVQTEQLVQDINQYQQMLTDYDHYLTMVKSLGEYVDTASLKSILKTTKIDGAQNPFGDGFDVSVYTDSGVVSLNNELKRIYKRGRSVSTMTSDVDSFGGPSSLTANATQTYEQSQLATLQAVKTDAYKDEINDRIDSSDALSDALDSVQAAPESQVATLQLMAQQNQAIQGDLHTIAKIQNEQLNYSNQLPAKLFGALAVSQDNEIKRLKQVAANPPIASTSGFDKF